MIPSLTLFLLSRSVPFLFYTFLSLPSFPSFFPFLPSFLPFCLSFCLSVFLSVFLSFFKMTVSPVKSSPGKQPGQLRGGAIGTQLTWTDPFWKICEHVHGLCTKHVPCAPKRKTCWRRRGPTQSSGLLPRPKKNDAIGEGPAFFRPFCYLWDSPFTVITPRKARCESLSFLLLSFFILWSLLPSITFLKISNKIT